MDIDTPISNADRQGSSGGHSNHGGSSTGGNTASHGSMMMNMLFHTSFKDTLFGPGLTPKTQGHYAGIIIFLIVLTVIYRFLLAFKSISEHNWARRDIARNREVVVAGSTPEGSQENVGDGGRTKEEKEDPDKPKMDLSPVVKEKYHGWGIPWRFSTELPRAVLSAIVAGLGYLM